MNTHELERNIRRDVTKAMKDLNMLRKDTVARVSKIQKDFGQSRKTLSSLVENNVSQFNSRFEKFNHRFEKLRKNATKIVKNTTKTARKDVSSSLNQYQARVKKLANKMPGGFNTKTSRYPWAAISIALIMGLMMGSFLKPVEHCE